MIDQKDFPKPTPVIKPSDLNGANVAVATVASVEQVNIGGDKKVLMEFDEFDGKVYYPNRTSIHHLIDALGADETKWRGKKVVLEVVKANDPQKKRQVEALWVASAETWDDHFAAADKRANRAGGSATETTTPAKKKSSGKKK